MKEANIGQIIMSLKTSSQIIHMVVVSGYDEIGHGQTVEQLPRNLILSRPAEIAYIAGSKGDIRWWHQIVQVFDGGVKKALVST